jgi:pyruvate formate lyase activating enzyme
MKVNFGGIVPLSTVDWLGRAAMVVFLRGCPLRCPHCHNSKLQTGENSVELYSIINKIVNVKTLRCDSDPGQIKLEEAFERVISSPGVDALILSGGEPLVQIEQVIALSQAARGLNLKVGLETCGYYPDRLSRLLNRNLIDMVFLDVKAKLQDPEYSKATGISNVAPRVLESLKISMRAGVPLEVRTAVFPEMPSERDVIWIARNLLKFKGEFPDSKLESMVLHLGRPIEREFEPIPLDRLNALARSVDGLIEIRAIKNARSHLSL